MKQNITTKIHGFKCYLPGPRAADYPLDLKYLISVNVGQMVQLHINYEY